MKRYRVLVSYDGTDFSGWQSQDSANSIQSSLQACISTVLKDDIVVCGASRTDKGVHAIGQVAHFDTNNHINNYFKFLRSVNGILPRSIRVFAIEETDQNFHARFDATAKIYTYNIHTFHCHTPWSYSNSCKFHSLDIEKMKEASIKIKGTKSFKSFTNRRGKNCTEYSSFIRTVTDISILKHDFGITIQVEGDGFLYKMVRNIVGFLIGVGWGKINENEINEIIKSEKRDERILTVPAKGLTLKKVTYKQNVFTSFNL